MTETKKIQKRKTIADKKVRNHSRKHRIEKKRRRKVKKHKNMTKK